MSLSIFGKNKPIKILAVIQNSKFRPKIGFLNQNLTFSAKICLFEIKNSANMANFWTQPPFLFENSVFSANNRHLNFEIVKNDQFFLSKLAIFSRKWCISGQKCVSKIRTTNVKIEPFFAKWGIFEFFDILNNFLTPKFEYFSSRIFTVINQVQMNANETTVMTLKRQPYSDNPSLGILKY